jgi:hypothetical protein
MLRSVAGFRALRLALLAALPAVVCNAPCFGQEQDEYLGERPERYAMVRIVEGKVKITKWDYDEELTVGTPVAEGDVIQSEGRGVIQLGDGTRIAFGGNTKLDIATMFDYRDGGTQALFRLDHGRIRLAVGPQSGANIRIDTSLGSATLGARSNAYIEVGLGRPLTLRVFSGSVAFRNRIDAVSVLAGDSLTANGDNDRLDRVRPFNTYQLDSFEAWADRHLAPGQQASRHVPQEIRYYADTLDGYGDWVDVVDVGWCWRPRVAIANWRPYWRGHWGPHRGGMTWVSYDPFGYVTHHHGRWGWSSMYGWYWIPGVYYSPAWVAWSLADAFFGWAPLGYYTRPIHWGYNGWHHDCWMVVDYRHIRNRNVHNYSRWDNRMGKLFPAYEPSRTIAPAWSRSPLVVTRKEFDNPNQGQLRSALTREVSAQRLGAYEAQAGRQVIVRRDVAVRSVFDGGPDAPRPAQERPFEDSSTRRKLEERPVLRETAVRPQRGGDRPADGSGDRAVGRDADTVGRRPLPAPGDSSKSQDGRRSDAPTPSRSYETREPSRPSTPPARGYETREPSRPSAPPARSYETREPSRSSTPPARSYETREPSRPAAPPTRSEPAPAPPARASEPAPARSSSPPSSSSSSSSSSSHSYSSPSRPSSPPPSSSSPSPSRSAPPPDRSRNSRR